MQHLHLVVLSVILTSVLMVEVTMIVLPVNVMKIGQILDVIDVFGHVNMMELLLIVIHAVAKNLGMGSTVIIVTVFVFKDHLIAKIVGVFAQLVILVIRAILVRIHTVKIKEQWGMISQHVLVLVLHLGVGLIVLDVTLFVNLVVK